MNWLDYLGIMCTIASGVGAFKSNAYYKKSKQLTIYANTNIAYIESQKIIATLTEMLKLGNNIRKRGTNYIKEVSQHGENIKISINKIRESLPVKDFTEINELLNSQQPEIDKYIDSFITGTVLVDEKLVIDDNFNKCQQAFCEMQLLIKKKLENISEKLK
ncbi:hypothetical protein FDB29_07455 [Clostridium botulinum]|nr:hypothetical protein [Clostridium botulinum]